jgi:hypothetical protein
MNTSKVWYVTVVDMGSADVLSLIGTINPGGHTDNSLSTQPQASFWTQAEDYGAPLAVVNMAFVGYPSATETDRAGIAYGLKVPSPSYFAQGYEALGDRYILGWNGQSAASVWNSADGVNQFNPGSYDNAVGGLSVHDCRRCDDSTGRTFVGVRGDYLLIFSAQNATSAEARAELSRWQPTAVMQGDGGGSSFLIVNGQGLVNTDGRPLPHAVAVYP